MGFRQRKVVAALGQRLNDNEEAKAASLLNSEQEL
jgi:hypothetical protein